MPKRNASQMSLLPSIMLLVQASKLPSSWAFARKVLFELRRGRTDKFDLERRDAIFFSGSHLPTLQRVNKRYYHTNTLSLAFNKSQAAHIIKAMNKKRRWRS